MKILWDLTYTQTNYYTTEDQILFVVNSADKTVEIFDVAIPGDKRVQQKEKEKIDHYTDLKI